MRRILSSLGLRWAGLERLFHTGQKRLWMKIMFPDEETQFVLALYKKYKNDLCSISECQKKFYVDGKQFGLNPQLCDLEAEITYLRIREFRPKNVVEISPASGWSTSWILHALKDNGAGTLHSFDLTDACVKTIPSSLSSNRWEFYQGDVKQNLDKLSFPIDYLFIDSDHSASFAAWYIESLFPLLSKGGKVSAHDIVKYAYEPGWGEESRVLCNWLVETRISCFTASRALKDKGYDAVVDFKKRLDLKVSIHPSDYNSMIFFSL